MAREYFAAYHSYLEAIEPLGDAERGRLFTACLVYSKTGEAPELRGNERFLFAGMKSQIDRDCKNYAERCATNRNNVLRRYTNADEGLPEASNPSKEKAKEREKAKGKTNKTDDDDPRSLRAKERELTLCWERVFGKHPSPAQADELGGWLAEWDAELICEAIRAAAEADAQNRPAYIRATLNDWKARGIHTAREWGEAEARRDGVI